MTLARYQIELTTFQGPLDLLLHLIERQELDITTISLVNITEQYLKQVESMKESRIEQLIDFLVVGARLSLIKSRALLPQSPIIIEGEEPEEDPAEELLRQLKTYRRFKRIAAWLQNREAAGLRTYLRVAPPLRVEAKLDLSGITPNSLAEAVLAVLARAQEREESVAIAAPRQITIEGQIGKLRRTFRIKPQIYFEEILSARATRVELSVTLLAVLELIKRQEIQASQPLPFGPIELSRIEQAA